MDATLAETRPALAGASHWARYPSLYEINTWVWLSELSRKYGKSIDLSSLPSAEWDAIAAYGFDAVWLMGVWERSPAGITIANRNKSLLEDFRRALPDFRFEDNVGSPYCVRRYVVDEHLGGFEGLAVARRELSMRGMNLILDFVPNHVAPDHPWVAQHPEYFIRGSADDVRNDPSSFVELRGTVCACGRDPYFPAWPDVLQMNAFEPGLRHAVIETISSIAQRCDGIRCDMAMLMLNQIFERTWGGRAGPRPSTEYWVDVISATKNKYPGFLFVAEAYWDLEWELQQQGFDFCYDKKLYEGQFEGRKVRPPVFLGRRPKEPVDLELCQFYKKLLEAVNRPVFREGQWTLCERAGWFDNNSFQNLVAWSWQQQDERYLIVVNLSDHVSQAHVRIPWGDASEHTWHLSDLLTEAIYERDGREMMLPGLYVELGPWNYHFFQCLRPDKDRPRKVGGW